MTPQPHSDHDGKTRSRTKAVLSEKGRNLCVGKAQDIVFAGDGQEDSSHGLGKRP